MAIDIVGLSDRWATSWPGTRPIGRELRKHRENWVRFHALPGSKRYPENDREYAEILRRHNLLLGELTNQRSKVLLVLTMAWSGSAVPVARDQGVVRAIPEADLWTSINGGDDEFPSWYHVYVTPTVWQAGVLNPLLRLVADDGTDDVTIADADFEWLLHPYDGGVDVITRSTHERDQIRARHSDWLSSHPDGL